MSTESASVQSGPVGKGPSIGIVVGGRIDRSRRAAAASGEQPRVDVLEMEEQYPAHVYDLDWLRARADDEWATRALVKAFGRFGRLSEALVLRLAVQAGQHDALYATGEDVGLPLGVLLRLVRRSSRPRLVMRVEQLHYGRTPLRRRAYQAFTKLAGGAVDVFVCRTHAYEDYLRRELGVPSDAIAFAPEPIDDNFFDVTRVASERPAFVPKERFLFSAGLEMRDYDTLVRAVQGLPLKVIIAAGSPWSHNRYEMANGTQPDNVEMRRFSQREMRELYAYAEAVVVPVHQSLRSCGISVINEAAHMKVPVIATRTEGLATYIVDGVNGLLAAPSDATALRQAIESVLNGRQDLAQMTARAYERSMERAPLQQYVDFVYGLLAGGAH